jgi:autotransporter strand-loop-strand O-heptosyltransferase
MSSKIQVMAHTSFLGHTGYNNHSRNFFTNLNRYIPTKVRNYSYCDDLSYLKPEEMSVLTEQPWDDPPHKIGSPFVRDPEATLVNLVLNESHHYYFYDKYESPMIAYNVWEATKQIPEYFNRILEYDQFWCPTEWQRQCTIDQGYPEHRVKVVPEGVNGNIFCPTKETNPLLAKKHFYQKYDIPYDTFLFMIFGRWDYRKSTTEMIQAFTEKFKDEDNVMLLLSVDNPFPADKLKTTEERLAHHKIPTDKLKVVHFPPREDYIKFLQYGNCLLGCSRSEGWNLPLMEAISCGTPTIASNWGGHLEFADGISHLVNVPKELPPKQVFMLGDKFDYGVWGEPDFDHLKDVMWDVYKNYHDSKKNALKRSKFIRELYTWDNAARKAEGYIKELAKTHIYVPETAVNNLFKTNFSLTDDKCPKVTFVPKRMFNKLLVKIKRLTGATIYESWFDNVKHDLGYWVSVSIPESQLKGVVLEIYDENETLIHSEKKTYFNDKPKVSFVTSFYNAEKFIDELSSSVFEQTMDDWEWIITDDWSQDDTKKKLLRLAESDRRIHYVEQEFKQEIYWNPHKYASGEFICNIDADDAIVPKTAQVLVHFYKKYPMVQCIHTSGNYYLEDFSGHASFKNPSYCRMDNYDSVLQKHIPYLKNDSGYERLGQMFGVIRSYRNPGPDFNFNDANYQLGKHEDLVKLLRLEELGVPFYLNRTLYKVRLREEGSNSGTWKDYGGDNEFDKIRNAADKRRKKAYKHLGHYDSIREELYAFLYSKLHDEKTKKKICCLGFNLDEKKQNLIREIYFDHNLIFEEVDVDADYIFVLAETENDAEMYNEITSTIRKAEVVIFFNNKEWKPDFYDLPDGAGYYKTFENSKDALVQKRSFAWTTYLYKYCTIIYDVERPLRKLNLGCGNDIKPGYINVDKYNNTGNVDYQWDLGKLEVPDGDLDEIYLAHVFEHIGINDIYAVVEEWRRALKPNGDLILRLPNLEHEVKIWLDAPPEKKWNEVHRIFGSQSHEGNTHFSGHNPESLKAFIEKFDFDVVEVGEQNNGYGNEIYLHAKKKPKVKRLKAHYICHFVDGPYLEIRAPKTNNFFIADFLDPDNNSSVHQQTMEINHWTRPHRKYFTNWLIQVRRNGILDYEHKFDANGKNVLISFDTKSLGDSIAWVPAVEEFRKKHGCNVYLSTFWNKLFDEVPEYSNITFVPPGDVVNDLYASYMVGCHDGDINRNKIDWRLVPLQKVAFDMLGLEYKEIVPSVVTQTGRKLVTENKYVTISEFSTFQSKFWNFPGGWQTVVDYLVDLGYDVVVISKEKTNLKNVIDRTNRTMAETINTIKHADFHMGVSAGPSWLAWALKRPVVLISGYSAKWGEFKTRIKRVINEDVCHGCFNDPTLPLDRGDWNWCPRQKGTPKQFECTKRITPDMVKKAIDEIIAGNYDRIA